MAYSSTQFVSCAALDSAFQLGGDRGLNPMNPGQTIIGHGTFDDGTETGPAAFVVLRNVGKQMYLLAPLGSQDPYWADHLSKTPQVRARIMRSEKCTVPSGMELIRRWRVLAEAGCEPKRDDFTFLGRSAADGIGKKWAFLNELVVADNATPQE